jgi:YVTN family beta-propeller protein
MKTILFAVFSIAVIGTLIFMPSGQTRIGDEIGSVAHLTTAEQPKPSQLPVVGHPTFVSPHANPIAIIGDRVFVVNTPASTVDVINADTRKLEHRIPVGVDPVSIAVRPDGLEVWVANHVSDSVSVIDNDSTSPTYLHVVATIQEFDSKKATTFDEPVGIAFASNDKAYVALSSENQIAVVNVASRKITKRLKIPAQDPRAITVRNGKLFVVPFESNNQTQLSGGKKEDIDGKLVTFDAWEHSITHNNVLSLGHVVDIVKHPKVPDRDLFVFDTETDELIETVDSLGTLLYGLTVASDGTVFVAQTDARNDVNGRSGTQKHNLSQLENRAFLNRITRVNFGDTGESREPKFIELEPLPPMQPEPGQALATPFAIQISDDDSTLVVSAAASDKVFTVDAKSGEVLGRVDVDAVPRGIALEQRDGRLTSAWVLNAVANTVSLVDLTNREAPQIISTVTLSDPTHPAVKRGRIAFETAAASSTGTFSCASCHPDGHTDQLLWVLKTPTVSGGDQIMPRSTMPVRGLRDTAPYHWDGIPGDPYGGINSGNIHGNDKPNSNADDPASSVRHLIDGGLASTMAFEKEDAKNDEGKVGKLSAAERDDMATYLLSVPYPPAQRRPYTSEVTQRARDGFRLFHIDGDNDPSKPIANVCGDCHRMPHLVSTNTPGTGMEAPTWRGAYDRFLILPQGRLNIHEFPFYREVAERGQSEEEIWRFSWGGRERFNPVWDMVLEMSTGYSGAFARQVTLSKDSLADESALGLLDALEQAARDGAVVLQGDGVRISAEKSSAVLVQFAEDGRYHEQASESTITRDELLANIRSGELTITFTARHGEYADVEHPQPVIWTVGPIEKQRGKQEFPVLYPGETKVLVSGHHVDRQAHIFIDGHRVDGEVALNKNDRVTIELMHRPENGMHLLQLQNPNGQFSNDFILNVAERKEATAKSTDKNNSDTDTKQDRPKTLADALERSGWARLIGTWVDEGSKGEGLKLSFRWKIKDRVIEAESINPGRTSVSLISVNASNGDIFQVGADSTGSSHLGTWSFKKDDAAVLDLNFTGGDGTQGQVTLRYKLVDDDKLDLTIALPEPIQVRLVRASE